MSFKAVAETIFPTISLSNSRRSWGGGIALGPGEGNSSEGREGKDLDLGQG